MKFYSASKNAFFAGELQRDYESAGNWPGDAVQVSPDVHAEFTGNPPAGKRMVPDNNGLPSWTDVPEQPASVRKKRSKSAIDASAGRARARFVSTGQLIEEEYREAEKAVQQWRSAGSPPDQVPEEISAWIDAANMTAEEAATDIEQTALAWKQVLTQIRTIRLTGKAAVDNAADDSDFMAVAQPYIDQLDVLEPTAN